MEHALTINLDQQVGPAGIHATRLCILNNKDESISCAFAGKREVHICSFKQSDGRSSNCINTINGLPFPSKLQEFEVTNTGINLPNDIQSITYSNGILAVADCQGNCFASNIHENTSKEYENTRNSGLFKSTGKWEQSWTGIALNGSKNPILACSGLLAAETVFWDVETSKQERNNIYHAQSPTASQFLSIGPSAHSEKYLVTAEWNTVVARDLRARISEVACILNMNKSPLYGLDISGDGNTLVFGGESRDISFVDVRKWAIRSKWKCPLKSVIVVHLNAYSSLGMMLFLFKWTISVNIALLQAWTTR